jgi:hypothetical protein
LNGVYQRSATDQSARLAKGPNRKKANTARPAAFANVDANAQTRALPAVRAGRWRLSDAKRAGARAASGLAPPVTPVPHV